MTAALTIEGELPDGVEVDGVVHREFTLRLPSIRDNIDAVDEVGTTNSVALSAAILSRQLVKLGTLPPEKITFDLVAGMHPEDFNFMEAKATELEKKRKARRAGGPTGSASGLPSAAPA